MIVVTCSLQLFLYLNYASAVRIHSCHIMLETVGINRICESILFLDDVLRKALLR